MRLAHALAVAAIVSFVSPAMAQQFTAGDITVAHPWARATPKGASVGAGYMAISNKGAVADTLIRISTEAAGDVQMHETKKEGGVTLMRPLAGGLAIPAGGGAEFKPGGYHIMFTDLKAPFRQGDKIKAVLTFEHAGAVPVEFKVEGVGAMSPATTMDGNMPGMKMN